MENKTCKPFSRAECKNCYLNNIVGISDEIFSLIESVSKIMCESEPVLILGESGSGKELFAKALHESMCSPRKNEPFITKNCGGMDSNILYHELFGHEKGSFTGALSSGKKGLFEMANGGTLFLDEIGDISEEIQVALLRAIEERKINPIGGREMELNVRIIAATNKDIPQLSSKGKFRKELFYRFVYLIHLPLLKQRKEDILPLSLHFLRELALKNSVPDYVLTTEVMKSLKKYQWPGNIRELKNCLKREVSFLPKEEFVIRKIPNECKPNKRYIQTLEFDQLEEVHEKITTKTNVVKPLWMVEKEAIIYALRCYKGNRMKCADALQISRNTLYRKMKNYNITFK